MKVEVIDDAKEHLMKQMDTESGDVDTSLLSFTDVFKLISSLALPMSASFTFSIELFLMIILLNNINETEEEVAATTLIATLLNTLIVVGVAPLFAMNLIASNKIGELEENEAKGEDEEELQKKREYIAGVNRNGLFLSAALAAPITLGMVFSKPLLTGVFGQNDQVAELTQQFLRTYAPAIPPLMLRITSEQLMFSFKRAKEAMYIGLASLGIGTGLSAWLGLNNVYGPQLGATGIAIGYVVESYLTAAAYALYLARHKSFQNFEFYNLLKRFEGQARQFWELLQVGGSITFAIASEMAMSLSVSLLAGSIGTLEQSAVTYLNQFIFFDFLFASGFGQTCAQEVNRLLGAKKYENASRVGTYGLITTLIYTSPVPILFAIAPQWLIISNDNQTELEHMLKILTPIMSVGVIVDAARFNLLQQLRPLNDLKTSTLISVSSLSTGIIASAVLGLKTSLGVHGVAIGFAGGVIIATPALMYRWHHRIKATSMRAMAAMPEPEVQTSSSTYSIARFFPCCHKETQSDEEAVMINGSSSVSYGSFS
jgi:Na+-driven multidrug efflux pump